MISICCCYVSKTTSTTAGDRLGYDQNSRNMNLHIRNTIYRTEACGSGMARYMSRHTAHHITMRMIVDHLAELRIVHSFNLHSVGDFSRSFASLLPCRATARAGFADIVWACNGSCDGHTCYMLAKNTYGREFQCIFYLALPDCSSSYIWYLDLETEKHLCTKRLR